MTHVTIEDAPDGILVVANPTTRESREPPQTLRRQQGATSPQYIPDALDIPQKTPTSQSWTSNEAMLDVLFEKDHHITSLDLALVLDVHDAWRKEE